MSRVYIGMSGGVDSSLTAALLVRQGYDVTGVYMQNWINDVPGMRCPWADDLADAKRVAVHLGIPFKVFDFRHEYKQLVVDYMIGEYQAGRTPNPDIMCNQEVKFGLFRQAALRDGAGQIATGHYARSQGSRLMRAVNQDKDQTYFLYRITGEAVTQTIFPLGNCRTKAEVRTDAERLGLSTARKPDSQGICFVGTVNMRDFLGQYIQTEPGEIIDQETGRHVGEHDGAIFYTLGQRHGLNVGGGLPYYVVGKDMGCNIVYVSRRLDSEVFWRNELTLSQLSWINEAPVTEGDYLVRVRHRAPLKAASVRWQDGDRLVVTLKEPERAVASGQSVVIYDDQVCLGGGVVC